MKWLDKIPVFALILGAVFMLGAPFVPVPHSLEKVTMLLAGELSKPIDIFDLFWHFTPLVLLLIRLYRLKTGVAVVAVKK